MKRNCLLSILQRRFGTVGVSEKIHVQNLGSLQQRTTIWHTHNLDLPKEEIKENSKLKEEKKPKVINKCLFKCLYVFFSLSPSFLPSSPLVLFSSFFAGRAKIQRSQQHTGSEWCTAVATYRHSTHVGHRWAIWAIFGPAGPAQKRRLGRMAQLGQIGPNVTEPLSHQCILFMSSVS